MINIDDRLLAITDEKKLWLLMHIAKHMGNDMTSFPSKATLIKATGWGKNKLDRVLLGLKKDGTLKVFSRFIGGAQVPNLYKIDTKLIGIWVGLGKVNPAPEEGDPHPQNGETPTPETGVPPHPQNGDDPHPQNGDTEVLTSEVLTSNNSVAKAPVSAPQTDENRVVSAGAARPESYSFEEFWNDYDFKRGSKKNAAQKWKHLKEGEKAAIKKTLESYKRDTVKSDVGRGGNFKPMRKHPEFYLGGKIWETYEESQIAKEKPGASSEWGAMYKAYIEWVKETQPHLSDCEYLSQDQYSALKSRTYDTRLRLIGEEAEKRTLKNAHTGFVNPEVKRQYSDVFAYHCHLISERLKANRV